MNLQDIGAYLYLISIPLFVIGLIILIIQIIRKKKKKAAVLVMAVSVLMLVSGIFLPSIPELVEVAPSISTENIKEQIESEAVGEVSVYCMFNYKDVENTLVNVTSVKQNGNTYIAYGKVNIIDSYGDKYVGNFKVTYRLVDNELEKVDLSVDTPRKQ